MVNLSIYSISMELHSMELDGTALLYLRERLADARFARRAGHNWIKLVKEKVKSGRYTSSSEVIREGSRLLDEQDLREGPQLAHLRPGLDSPEPVSLPRARGWRARCVRGWRALARR